MERSVQRMVSKSAQIATILSVVPSPPMTRFVVAFLAKTSNNSLSGSTSTPTPRNPSGRNPPSPPGRPRTTAPHLVPHHPPTQPAAAPRPPISRATPSRPSPPVVLRVARRTSWKATQSTRAGYRRRRMLARAPLGRGPVAPVVRLRTT